MKFEIWVDLIGQKKLAKRLRVNQSAISNWKHSKRRPSIPHLYKMHRIANGKLSYNEMINHFMKCRR